VSPFSAPVLGGATLVSAPSWWNVVQGLSPVTDAMTRFLVCVAICWVALELLAAFVGPVPAPSSGSADSDTAGADVATEMADQAPPA
jgi:hypothetical protein